MWGSWVLGGDLGVCVSEHVQDGYNQLLEAGGWSGGGACVLVVCLKSGAPVRGT